MFPTEDAPPVDLVVGGLSPVATTVRAGREQAYPVTVYNRTGGQVTRTVALLINGVVVEQATVTVPARGQADLSVRWTPGADTQPITGVAVQLVDTATGTVEDRETATVTVTGDATPGDPDRVQPSDREQITTALVSVLSVAILT